MLVLPELFTLCCSFLYLVLGLKGDGSRGIGGLAVAMSLIGFGISLLALGERGVLFGGAYGVDGLSQLFKALVAFGLFLTLAMAKGREDAEGEYRGEFYAFLTLSAFGLMALVSAKDLLTLFLALEVSSYPLYLAIPLRRAAAPHALEGAVKYILFGAVASGLTLYGMGYLYAQSGSTFLHSLTIEGGLGLLALALVLCGFFFKLSLFPFHFWSPDVYQGASAPLAAFVAAVPKVGALAVLLRLMAIPSHGDGLVGVIGAFAVLSMTFGNLAALVQRDLKRLMAYSGIAHAGYLMLGIVAMGEGGRTAAAFYTAVYLLMTLGLFMAIVFLSGGAGDPGLDDLRGLYRRSPLLAFTLAVSAFALVGIPPTGGFMGKLLLFSAAFEAGYLGLVVVGAVNTALSLFYYLNLVRLSYCREPEGGREGIPLGGLGKALCLALTVLVLLLGVLPTTFVSGIQALLTT